MLTTPILSKMNGEKSKRFIELQTNDKISLFWRLEAVLEGIYEGS